MDFKIIYSKRKTVGLTVKDGKLIVRSPRGVKPEYLQKVVEEKQGWIQKHIALQRERQERVPTLTAEEIESLKKRAKPYFIKLTDYYANIMGLKYGHITITSAKTRFGSCNSRGNICYSYRLLFYPIEAQEYVVVHELSHLVYMNHSKSFYAHIEKYMSDYKEREKLLK